MKKRGRAVTGQKLKRITAKKARRHSRRSVVRREIAVKRIAAFDAYLAELERLDEEMKKKIADALYSAEEAV